LNRVKIERPGLLKSAQMSSTPAVARQRRRVLGRPCQISAFSLMDFPQVRQWSVFAWVPVAAVGRGTPQ